MNKILLLVFLFAPVLATAQQITGVTVSKGELLPGATVTAGSLGTQTDLNGKFTLVLKHTGKVTLTFRYLGYTNKTLDIEVKAGLNNIGDIELAPAAGVLGEVIVNGASAGSQVKAISIKKNATGIMEVLAADAIGKLPDRNAAEAVQRMQAVSIERDGGEGRYVSVRGTPIQWSATLLNGNRLPSASLDYTDRRVQMDIFPSELIEYVQLSKALTPDIEGDAIGGSINFITKAAPQQRVLNINAAGGYNAQSDKGSYNASVVYGDRVAKGKLGYLFSAVVWKRTTGIDRYTVNYDFSNPNKTPSYSITDLQLRDYLAGRRTTGLNGGIEYKFNDRHKVQLKGIYTEYQDVQMVRENYFYFNTGISTITTRSANYNTNLYSAELSGQHTLSGKLNLDWAASTDKSRFKFGDPGSYPMAFFGQKVSYDGLAPDGKKYLAMDAPNGAGDKIDAVLPHLSATTPVSPDAMTLTQVVMLRSTNWESNKRFGVNLNYHPSEKLKIKFGGKVIYKDKLVETPLNIYMAGITGKAPTLTQIGTEPFPYNGGFLTEINAPYKNVMIDQMPIDQVRNLITPAGIAKYSLFPIEVDSATNASGAGRFFTGKENVYALYAMGEYKLSNKITIIGGIRNEYSKVTFKGNKVISKGGSSTVAPLTQDNSYNAFLPMLHVKVNATTNDIIRLAYTRTFARADFNNLNPATTQDETNRVITRGNADLRPTFANNFDLMAEHYFGGVGSVTFGAFYKRLTDLIYTNESSQEINGVVYRVSEPVNMQSAWLGGLEAGFSKRFTNLPGFWKGFGVDLNYTFTNSKVKIPRFVAGQKIEDESVIPKQAKHVFNASVMYEYGKFTARVAGNYKGKYLDVIRQAAGPDHYRWYAQNFTVDFSSSYSVTPKVRLFAELNNLTNAPVRYYHGTYNRPEEANWFSIRGQVGASIKLF